MLKNFVKFRINRMRLILDPAQNAPWVRLARLYTASNICRWNMDWPFLNGPNIPKIDFHDFGNGPYRLRLQPYHREFAEFLRDHKREFLKLKIISTSSIYGILLKNNTPRVRIHGQVYWNGETKRALP